jgi:hypothetical protein
MTLSPHSIYFYLHALQLLYMKSAKINFNKYNLKTVFDPLTNKNKKDLNLSLITYSCRVERNTPYRYLYFLNTLAILIRQTLHVTVMCGSSKQALKNEKSCQNTYKNTYV